MINKDGCQPCAIYITISTGMQGIGTHSNMRIEEFRLRRNDQDTWMYKVAMDIALSMVGKPHVYFDRYAVKPAVGLGFVFHARVVEL